MSAEKVSFQVAGVDGCKAGWFVAIASLTKQESTAAHHELTPIKVFIADSFGKKLSKQSFALLAKIRQVDDVMTPALQGRVREIHPEVSFWALNGKQPMPENKKTAPGQAQRHKLLQEVLPDVNSILAQAPTSGYVMDDALDALVAAWTAAQVVMRKAKTLPERPELDGKGLRMEILCPGW